MKFVFGITIVFFLCAVIFAAPPNSGYDYKAHRQLLQKFLPENSIGIEIKKLDCQTIGPTVKEADGTIITTAYYNCGDNGQRKQKPNTNGGYLPRRKVTTL